jgi:hypothetical protein
MTTGSRKLELDVAGGEEVREVLVEAGSVVISVVVTNFVEVIVDHAGGTVEGSEAVKGVVKEAVGF